MDGHLMTQSQEEMALIGIFALFWIGEHLCLANDLVKLILIIVLLVAWKSLTNNKQSGGVSTNLAIHSASQNRGVSTSKDFCAGEGVYCIYEEYAMF
jgi:hypothetical protein